MAFYLGLDFGTSGARASVLDEAGEIAFESRASYVDPASPQAWREALFGLIEELPADIRTGMSALAIAGTSGTPAKDPESTATPRPTATNIAKTVTDTVAPTSDSSVEKETGNQSLRSIAIVGMAATFIGGIVIGILWSTWRKR